MEWGHREHIKDNIRDNDNQADRGFLDFVPASIAFPFLGVDERWLLSEWRLEPDFYRTEADETDDVRKLKATDDLFKAYQKAGKVFPEQSGDDDEYRREYSILSRDKYTAKKLGEFDLRVRQQQLRLEEFRLWKTEKRGKDKSKARKQ